MQAQGNNSKKRKNPPGFMDAIASPRKKARVQYSPLSRANGMVCRPSNQSHGRRLVIQKLSDLPQLPPDFQEVTWKKLSAAISAVHEMRPIEDSTESLYHCVKDLCTHKVASMAYQSLQSQCTSHLESVRVKLSNSCRVDDDMSFLLEVESIWNAHCTQIRIIRDIFLYLDRTYVIQEADAKSIWDLGLTLFRTVALRDTFVITAIVEKLLKEVEKDRNGETVRRSLLQTLVRMFTTLEIYADRFEPPFLEQSRSFYMTKGSERINSHTPSEYLSFVEKQLHGEAERVSHYLDQSSGPALCSLVHELLVTQHASVILDRSFDDLMNRHATNDLKILYRLFQFTGLLSRLRERFKNYVRETGLRIVMDTKKDDMMIDDILNLKRKIDGVHQSAFERNQEFAHSLKDAFEYFLNQRQNKPAELVARFIDLKLRRGQKTHTETELESLMDEVIHIFRSIQAKDIFQGHYRNHLSTRLLTEKTASLEVEKSLISKLKEECGSGFTSKLENMFKDMNISKDLMSDFRQQYPHIDFTVNVLSRGIWPEWPTVEVNMPLALTEQQHTFEQFYNQKYNGRKLTWQNAKTHCVLSGSFSQGNKIFLTSLLQALVLMLFNDASRLSYQEIRSRLAASDEKMLKLSVQSLAFNKSMRLLIKGTKGPLTDGTLFAVNEAFSHKLVRMKVNQIQEKETEEEREKTNTSVFLERQYQIDAAIVRIMKTRKKLRHPILLSVLYEQLRFPLTPVDIKKRIESLIEREYLERDSEDSQVYSYLA